jgi:methionine-rich copper-binding protein CopC
LAVRAWARAAVLFAGLCLVTAPQVAWADTSLIGSVPANGSTVENRPRVVTLQFRDQIVPPAIVAVLRPDGTRVDVGSAQVVGSRVQQQVSDLPDGDYTVHFRVASVDRHPVLGELHFSVSAPELVRTSWFAQNRGQLGAAAGFAALTALVVALRLRARPSG